MTSERSKRHDFLSLIFITKSISKKLLIVYGVVPKTKCKTFGDRAFYKAGPDLWNHLPLSLRNTNDLQKFKKDLKTHLFRVAFLEH